jgi:Peptidase C13 family
MVMPVKKVLNELRLAFGRAIRFLTFRQVAKGKTGGHPATLILLCGIWFITKTAFDAVWAGNGWLFNEWGIVVALATWATFVGAMLLFHFRQEEIPVLRAIMDFAALGSIFNLIAAGSGILVMAIRYKYSSIAVFLDGGWSVINWVTSLWMLASLWRVGGSLWEHPPRLAGFRYAAAALATLFLIPAQPIVMGSDTDWSQHDVWYVVRDYLKDAKVETASVDNGEERVAVDYEATMYHQPALVAATLKEIRTSPPSTPQMYFVGFAPSSAQDVFKREVFGAKSAFDDRLGTKGRSIVLVNHLDSVDTIPLASATNLGMVLDGVGKAMDADKDVLVLFITSHGSKGQISVSLPGFDLNQVTPQILVKQLNAANIKNRVVIISACYSGSFIPDLKNDNTLIMTAASADKTSFGCSNEREWTYFGDALFNHALKDTFSLSQAFIHANTLVKEWESDQNLTPSDPQISIGRSILRVLQNIEDGM